VSGVKAKTWSVSTSPPPGEPGQSTSPELLYALFPPVEPTTATAPAGPARRRRWRVPSVPVLAALIVVVLLSGLLAVVDHGSTGAAAAAVVDSPISGSTADQPFAELPIPPPTTTTTLPPAPAAQPTKPIAPPADPTAPAPVVKIGEIRIPKIGLVHPIYEGITLTVIDHGPGHWPGSALPGQIGNAVFAGHRVTHTHPFRNIDKLVPGDLIQFVMPDGTYTYKMTAQQIVNPSDTWIVNPTPDATVTLFACHPPGSAAHRIVVRGVYVGKS